MFCMIQRTWLANLQCFGKYSSPLLWTADYSFHHSSSSTTSGSTLLLKTPPCYMSIPRYSTKNKVKHDGDGIAKSGKKFSDTVNLPQMPYALSVYKPDGRCNERENYIREISDFDSLYKWQRENNTGSEFIIHDGPPYANGDLHTGHALNKINKDIINRYRVMRGYRVEFVPGWDCHGLPIENKAKASQDFSLSDIQIRKQADVFSRETLDTQRSEFKSWGVMADWENPYITSDREKVVHELNIFQQLYSKGYIYEDYMPVYWSPSSYTALAEAELEYNDHHESTAVYVKLQLTSPLDFLSDVIPEDHKTHVVIWTTTPWTLPANQAVCYSDNTQYCLLQDSTSKQCYIVAEDLVLAFSEKLNKEFVNLKTFTGSYMNRLEYRHPIYRDRLCSMLPADHVNTTSGTGLVHTAPAHGQDDFMVALKHKLSRECIVDNEGCYTEEAGLLYSGRSVLNEGNKLVIDDISDAVLHKEIYIHRYPYDWRSKQPVILRASKQWFIDTRAISEHAVAALEDVTVSPAVFKSPLSEAIKQRPYWCISRQRAWGVPIPAFYDNTGRSYIHSCITDHIRDLIQTHGADIWWEAHVDTLLPPHIREQADIAPDAVLHRCNHILDIWFDSGITWSHVLGTDRQGTDRQADLYIEGMDQIGGWFQSSLLTCTALTGRAPYKGVMVHGFTVDENGKKMSKSVGNVVAPSDIIYGNKMKRWPAYGVDLLRWWAACKFSGTNVEIGPEVTKKYNETIHLLRKRMRFILGNLYDFSADSNSLLDYPDILPQDKYFLHLLYVYADKVSRCYEGNDISLILAELELFTTIFSNQFATMTKDRLYCCPVDSADRRSAQTVLHHTLEILVRSFAPILPFFSEDCYLHRHGNQLIKGHDSGHSVSVFRNGWYTPDPQWYNPRLSDKIAPVSTLMSEVMEVIGNVPSNNLEIVCVIQGDTDLSLTLQELQTDDVDIGEDNSYSPLCEILQCANVTVCTSRTQVNIQRYPHSITPERQGVEGLELLVRSTDKMRCERCRRFTALSSNEPCDMCLLNMADTWTS